MGQTKIAINDALPTKMIFPVAIEIAIKLLLSLLKWAKATKRKLWIQQ
jgi:hypothetical protein